MRLIIAFFSAVISTGLSHAACIEQAEAANSFMNEYKKYSDDSLSKKLKETREQWIQRNTKITKQFKKSYKKLVTEANKKEPEMGLGFDPIFDAQDYPDQGFKILGCDEKSNLVTLNGKGWEEFKVVVKVARTEKGWHIDGAGIVNIQKDERASRN